MYLLALVLRSFLVPLSLLGPVYRVLLIQLQHLHFLLDGLHVSSGVALSVDVEVRSVSPDGDGGLTGDGGGLNSPRRSPRWNISCSSAARDVAHI